jgi:hypothetical protein
MQKWQKLPFEKGHLRDFLRERVRLSFGKIGRDARGWNGLSQPIRPLFHRLRQARHRLFACQAIPIMVNSTNALWKPLRRSVSFVFSPRTNASNPE